MQFCSVLATELRQTFSQRRKMVANFDPWFFVTEGAAARADFILDLEHR
jgi:hypothetical protein